MPAVQQFPRFDYYPQAFLEDPAVEAMLTLEVGAYWLLLSRAWFENPVGSVPDDDGVLARWSRLSPRHWKKCREAVLRAFRKGTDGRYHQKRLQAEYAAALQRSERARGSAAARWGGDATALRSQSDGNADAMRTHSDRIAIAERSDSEGSAIAMLARGVCLPGTSTEGEKLLEKIPPPKDLLTVWNENRGGMVECKALSPKRAAAAHRRLAEYPGLQRWALAIIRAAKSGFCTGKGQRGWKGDFDWLLRPDTLLRIEEGSFDDSAAGRAGPAGHHTPGRYKDL